MVAQNPQPMTLGNMRELGVRRPAASSTIRADQTRQAVGNYR